MKVPLSDNRGAAHYQRNYRATLRCISTVTSLSMPRLGLRDLPLVQLRQLHACRHRVLPKCSAATARISTTATHMMQLSECTDTLLSPQRVEYVHGWHALNVLVPDQHFVLHPICMHLHKLLQRKRMSQNKTSGFHASPCAG